MTSSALSPLNSKKARRSVSNVSTYHQSRSAGVLDTSECNLYSNNSSQKDGKSLFLTSKSAPASRTNSLISAAGLRSKGKGVLVSAVKSERRANGAEWQARSPQPLPSTIIVFDNDGRTSQSHQVRRFDSQLIAQSTSDQSWRAGELLKRPVNQLPKIKTPCIPLSERKGSYKNKVAKSTSSLINLKTGVCEKKPFPVVGTIVGASCVQALKNQELSQCAVESSVVRKCSEVDVFINARRQEGGGREKHESDNKMKTARSELSLLEQKRLQWAKEREELNGLWSPWGRQSEAVENRVSPSVQMQASYPSPTNVVSSSYMANLGSGPSPSLYSQSYSECYLPPINSTIAQQPRQKAKVWNAEFQPEDYRYENDNATPSSQNSHRYSVSNSHRNVGVLQPRKASLPNYMYDSGENYHQHNNAHNHEGGAADSINHNQQHMWGSSPIMDEDAFTSGYYSENNNNNTDDGKTSSGKHQEVVLTPTSRERSYQEEVTVQKAIAVRGENNASPRVIMHKIFTQNGEMFIQHDGNQEVVVNSMTVSLDEGKRTPTGNYMKDKKYQHSRQDINRSPGGRLPRNHAMRSSLTIGVDASSVDAYNELERMEKQQWLNELEKQREEQRLRKMMEKEERRPRWGDRGIGVGHFWEPAESENSHLPAPPNSSRGKYTLSSRAESHGDGDGGYGDGCSPTPYHPVHSHTPPAWLERSLTRMQSSKSQPSLHDPDYTHDIENTNDGMSGDNANASKSGHQLLSSSRSLNHSTSDLVGFNASAGDILDRTYLRGHNVPIDPDTLNERERKRQANQEHLEALKKQIEAKQQQQREEKELRLQEEREQEIRIAKQREIELQRLEREKRGKMPVNGDMPNSVEDTPSEVLGKSDSSINTNNSKNSNPIHDTEEENDIEIVQRQSVLVTATPTIEDDDKTTESSDAIISHSRPRLSRQDQSVMTDMSDPTFERTLTPSFQRSRSLSLCRSNREFGTQTELSDGSTSSGASSCESSKNCDKNRSHNSLLDKKAKEKKQLEKKPEERPRWGSNPVKKLYVKQSEKDPNYVNRMKRRQERLKRMEEERSCKADTGTESEDVNIPFHRIRQRRNDTSPQRRMSRGITPMKATVMQNKTENSSRLVTASSSTDAVQQQQILDNRSISTHDTIKNRKTVHSREVGEDAVLSPTSNATKNEKSEAHLSTNKRQSTADIIDRNFGNVAGINVLSGTSEESSGFSTPFLPRRDLGSGSTGSGTTGSGSGVQSPDLTYHTYQANKSTREERKYAKVTSGRDTHSVGGNIHKNSDGSSSTVGSNKTSTVTSDTTVVSEKEFIKGFIPQRDFDEMPVKAGQGICSSSIISDVSKNDDTLVPLVTDGSPSKKKAGCKKSSPTRGRAMTMNNTNAGTVRQQQRNKSTSPQRKPRSPTKAKTSKEWKSTDDARRLVKSTANLSQLSMKSQCEEINLPNIPQEPGRPPSPPVPALLKKMQMGLQPDESGRMSSLPTEFPDILAPLPTIPIGLLSPNPSRLSSATSGTSSAGKIDIDIAVTPRNNPEIVRLFEAAEERIKQRQLNAILAGSNGKSDNDSGRSRTSFETDIGRISINLEPVMLFSNGHHPNNGGLDTKEFEVEVPASARLSIRSQPISPRPPPTPRDAALHEAFISSILNSKEVKEQLSARESELSEKGIIEFSIRLPSTSSGDELIDDYKDPLLTERRRHTAQWLYGGQNLPQKQAILTNLASLKKGIALQQQEWQVGPSDTD